MSAAISSSWYKGPHTLFKKYHYLRMCHKQFTHTGVHSLHGSNTLPSIHMSTHEKSSKKPCEHWPGLHCIKMFQIVISW
jgi:hypothetical protein